MKILRKFVSFLLTSIMIGSVFTVVPFTASAAVTAGWSDLQNRINASASVFLTLTRDITAGESDSCITIGSGKTVTLDLSGHTLSRGLTEAADNGSVITIERGGDGYAAAIGYGDFYFLSASVTMDFDDTLIVLAGSKSGSTNQYTGDSRYDAVLNNQYAKFYTCNHQSDFDGYTGTAPIIKSAAMNAAPCCISRKNTLGTPSISVPPAAAAPRW